ncbi:TonB-dependent receptor plug domain-containing protein [Sphingopyxis indica]|uniref:Iron complex outermembrane recepter protein n=1 Tax=Sphingopyxis indica TaxID=436663 RepID=A0A239JYK9_9SPHN|nr:TonB-dependent receptor [Sphingopyxis indica]SNT09944.1 iron complex outermembrane recepter protein [Sphingopyxis indica]
MKYYFPLAGFAALASGTAQAQSEAGPSPESEIIVTGTRSSGRAALESSAPVDVVSGETITATGFPDLGRALNFLQPSINFARAATTATAANTKPVTLRGLAPDQTLVLVNGKRRHANAVLNVNNSIGRGSAAVDLDTIPESAIERIEILRDGAAAQYGSDAIAGVVNIILKSNAGGASAELLGSITEEGDGETALASASAGFAVGDSGHLTLSVSARAQKPTNRAFVDQRFDRVTYRIGDPKASVASLAIDTAVPLGGTAELYGFGTLTRKISNNGAGFRVPGFSLRHPDGFLPIIEPRIWDIGATIGARAEVGALKADLSQSFGSNKADFRVFDTANVSLGLTSPTAFDSGGVTYRQYVTDFALSLPLDNVLAGGNIAAGGQYRHESYKIRSGEPDAYFGAGADGFAGFNPRNPTDEGRNAWAAFLDLELRPVRPLLLGGAVRHDHYGDFGGKTTWRATSRLELMEGAAIRATYGTGFRAPSLQQQFFSAVQGALSAGRLVTVGTLPVGDPVARALGASDLKPERSRNFTAGLVVGPIEGFSFTADYFHIRIKDRIALSEQLGGAAVISILTTAGITNFQQVRFFTNAIDTTTHGVEVTARWQGDIAPDTRLSLTAGYGWFKSRLDTLRPNPVLPALPLLNRKSILFVTEAQPKSKFTLQASIEHGAFDAGLNVAAFGTYTSQPIAAVQTFGGKETVDLSLGYRILPGVRFGMGVQNLIDAKPDTIDDQQLFIAATGGSFPTGEETPIGLNGRTWYARLSARF